MPIRPLHNGYARHFEHRPEFLFSTIVDRVVHALVPNWQLGNYRVARIEDVFSDLQQAILVLGNPNATLVVQNESATGYNRFAAYSLWRQGSEIKEITRESGSIVQSGIWLRFVNLPAKALVAIREAMEHYKDVKFRTCVTANMHVLEQAGFTSGNRGLSHITWPYELLSGIKKHGLEFEGEPVQLEYVRTTRENMEEYSRRVIWSQFTTPSRHAKRLSHSANELVLINEDQCDIAPALPTNIAYNKRYRFRVSENSKSGASLRQIFGPHAMFEVICDDVNVDKYLTRALRPFPQEKPDAITRLKKNILFSRPVVAFLGHLIRGQKYHEPGYVSESEIYDMLRTHSDKIPNKYNMVIVRMPTKEGRNPNVQIIMSRINVRIDFIDWILSKHVLMSDYLPKISEDQKSSDMTTPCVVWAGECWKESTGWVYMNGNSGTYQPTAAEDVQAKNLIQAIFSHLSINISS